MNAALFLAGLIGFGLLIHWSFSIERRPPRDTASGIFGFRSVERPSDTADRSASRDLSSQRLFAGAARESRAPDGKAQRSVRS